MGIVGYGVKDPNYLLRFSIIVFCGIIGFGVALSWRASLLVAADYQDIPVSHEQLKVKKENNLKKQSLQKKIISNYKIEE